jgi:hypothetical protein
MPQTSNFAGVLISRIGARLLQPSCQVGRPIPQTFRIYAKELS